MNAIKNTTLENDNMIQMNVADIVVESSYLFYEMRDVENLSHYEDPVLGTIPYTKYIHPLFSPNIVDASFNQKLLQTIFEETPFYYLEPSLERTSDSAILSTTRDLGKKYVPTVLQTPFWEVWFREIQGFFHNTLLLDVFNKLRYPYIDECQYMNAKLFPELAVKAFSTEDDGITLEFKTTIPENTNITEDEIGCLDYLDGVVNAKLQSNYSLIDYKPDQADLLAAWSESAYQSGSIGLDDLQKEQTIYKLQDISYELLRRKFAGSATLYTVALASVDRRGSFIRTVAIGDTYTGEERPFRDTRFARVVHVPNLITKGDDVQKLTPYESLFETPWKKGADFLPLDVVVPLYYTSSTASYSTAAFYQAEDKSVYLRDNTKVIDWKIPVSPQSGEAFDDIFTTLDYFKTEDGKKIYRRFDERLEIEMPDGSMLIEDPNRLDIKIDSIAPSVTTGNTLDINADTILYHENTLQKVKLDSYEYLTYPIADGNSLSLMDTQWITYLKSTTEGKSKVQDTINFGTQVSKYQPVSSKQTAEKVFFGISYGNDTHKVRVPDEDASGRPLGTYHEEEVMITSEKDIEILSWKEWLDTHNQTRPKYAYIWMYVLNYDIEKYIVDPEKYDVTATLISKVTLKISEDEHSPYTEDVSAYSTIDAFEQLQNLNIGAIPFTYSNLKNSKVAGLRLGLYPKLDGEKFYDDIDDLGYTKAAYIFTDSDLSNFAYSHASPLSSGVADGFATEFPSDRTRTVYYAVVKNYTSSKNEKGEVIKVPVYNWSEPIRVLNLSSKMNFQQKEFTIKPDWKGLCYHLNPELNFTLESASPLQEKPTLLAPFQGADYTQVTGATTSTALCNLVRTRNADFLCNDTGDDLSIWRNVDNPETEKHYGFYLEHFVTPIKSTADDVTVYVDVFGDNRFANVLDTNVGDAVRRSSIFRDYVLNRYCLHFADSSKPFNEVDYVLNNYFAVLPKKKSLISNVDWSRWWWNHSTDGISVFLDIEVSEIEIKRKQSEALEDAIAGIQKQKLSTGMLPLELPIVTSELEYLVAQREQEFSVKAIISGEQLPIPGTTVEFDFAEDAYGLPKYYLTLVFEYYTKDGVKKLTNNRILNSTPTGASLNHRIAVGALVASKKTIISLIVDEDVYSTEFSAAYYPQKKLNGEFLKGIELFSHLDINSPGSDSTESYLQTNMFKGNVYDVRIYNEGHSLENLFILNTGVDRENFSYAPSIYKLGYNIYRDLGIFKPVVRLIDREEEEKDKLPEISSIRVFNRPNWRSRLVDMYPLSAEEMDPSSVFYNKDYLDPKDDVDIYALDDTGNPVFRDAIQQELTPMIECSNNRSLGKLTDSVNAQKLVYGDTVAMIGPSDINTIVTTSLYPVTYENVPFSSGGLLTLSEDGSFLKTAGDHPIDIPVSAIDTTLKYQADIHLNFSIGMTSNFTSFYERGVNISRVYNELLNSSTVKLTVPSTKGTANNFILLPLMFPKQPVLPATTNIYFDRLNLNGVQFDEGFKTFLKATSYYSELRIPIAQEKSVGGEITYASKWDAIRCFKEGTYYFTNKYPVQILPFADEVYNISQDISYMTKYASSRFKIVVKGVPVEYDSEKWAIKGHPIKYTRQNLEATVTGASAAEYPEDNCTFPHRKIYIDLYVMSNKDVAGLKSDAIENYTWELIASNHTTKERVILLDKNALENNLCTSRTIPMFLSKDYVAPFFVANKDKSSYQPAEPVDNLAFPVDVKPIYNRDSLAAENISIRSLADLDNQVLVSGRSYKLLLDLNAKITELAYSDSDVSAETVGDMTLAEAKEYARVVDITPTAFPLATDYSYKGISNWYVFSLPEIVSRTSGYVTVDGGWKDVVDPQEPTPNNEFYFGNPYSKNSTKNYLLFMSAQQSRVNNASFFTYKVEDLLENTIQNCVYLRKISCIDRGPGNNGVEVMNTGVAFNELQILKDTQAEMLAAANDGIKALFSNASGILTQFSTITPKIQPKNTGGLVKQLATRAGVRTLNYDLIAYDASSRNVPFKNGGLESTVSTLFKNNLLASQDFTNKNYWETSQMLSRVSDNEHDVAHGGKDVYQVKVEPNTPFTLEYLTTTAKKKTTYEIAITAKGDNLKIVAELLNNDVVSYTAELQGLEVAQNGTSKYTVYSIQTPSVEATSIRFKFITTKPSKVRFTKAIVRVADILKHYLGLSDANTIHDPAINSLLLLEHSIVAFIPRTPIYKDVIEYLPIQTEASLATRVVPGTRQRLTYLEDDSVEMFIENNDLGYYEGNKKVRKLMQPWIRRIQFWESYGAGSLISPAKSQSRTDIRKYRVGTNASNIRTKQVDSGTSHDVISEIDLTYDQIGNITISKLKLNLVGDGDYKSLKEFNTNLKVCMNPQKEQGDIAEEVFMPASISNERFSATTNCFNPSQYLRGDASDVVVTNIQFLGKDKSKRDEILFELEYLPIIYNETEQHISFNLFLHKKVNA